MLHVMLADTIQQELFIFLTILIWLNGHMRVFWEESVNSINCILLGIS